MACDAPLSIRYDPPKPDGKGGFIYNFPGDCGKCMMCLKKRKAQWSFRIMEEKRNSFSSYFVTLTYKDEFLIYGDDGPTGSTDEHKQFIKFLRYYEDQRRLDKREAISVEELARIQNNTTQVHAKLKYYGVLEYGDDKKTQRPHYHYILFNVHDIDSIRDAWCEQVRVDQADKQNKYRPGRTKGRIQIDECNVNTVDYVLKYMIKEAQIRRFVKYVDYNTHFNQTETKSVITVRVKPPSCLKAQQPPEDEQSRESRMDRQTRILNEKINEHFSTKKLFSKTKLYI